MAVLDRTPENTNLLQPTKFLLTIDRIPQVTYFCQEANIPGIRTDTIEFSSMLHDFPLAGNKIHYSTFDIKFIVNENVSSWKSLYEWFLSFSSPKSFEERNYFSDLQNQFKRQSPKTYSEATLSILSATNNPILRVQYHGLFPISLSDVQFDTTLSADTIITADANFGFEYFEFLKT